MHEAEKKGRAVRGFAQPTVETEDATEAAALAEFALLYKRRPALAARLYTEALARDLTLLSKHRFNAARAALLAAGRTGLDARGLYLTRLTLGQHQRSGSCGSAANPSRPCASSRAWPNSGQSRR